jgi:hypothetical protein
MSDKPSDSTAHAYDPEPYPILTVSPEFWWLPDWERGLVFDTRARNYGGQGYIYRPNMGPEYER